MQGGRPWQQPGTRWWSAQQDVRHACQIGRAPTTATATACRASRMHRCQAARHAAGSAGGSGGVPARVRTPNRVPTTRGVPITSRPGGICGEREGRGGEMVGWAMGDCAAGQAIHQGRRVTSQRMRRHSSGCAYTPHAAGAPASTVQSEHCQGTSQHGSCQHKTSSASPSRRWRRRWRSPRSGGSRGGRCPPSGRGWC